MSLKTELKNIIKQLELNKPEHLLPDSPLTEANWNKVCTSIDNLTKALNEIENKPPDIPAIGSPYFRLPGMPEPWQLYTSTNKSEWQAVHVLYKGDFMRLAGGNASKFKTDGTDIVYDIKAGESGGGQNDCLQDHTHKYFEVDSKHQTAGGRANYFYSTGGWKETKEVQHAKADIETRPKNITIELYIFKGSSYYPSLSI